MRAESEKVRVHVCSRPREAGRGSGVVGGGETAEQGGFAASFPLAFSHLFAAVSSLLCMCCPGGSMSGGGASTSGLSTQVLTVLSFKGVQRLLKHSRSSLAPHVREWVNKQYELMIQNESLLREHARRSAQMDRLKHLPPSQSKAEETRLLRMEEEEEMDIHDGFEHLAGAGGASDEDEDFDGDEEETHIKHEAEDATMTGVDQPAAAAAAALLSPATSVESASSTSSSALETIQPAAASFSRPAAVASPSRSRGKASPRRKGKSSQSPAKRSRTEAQSVGASPPAEMASAGAGELQSSVSAESSSGFEPGVPPAAPFLPARTLSDVSPLAQPVISAAASPLVPMEGVTSGAGESLMSAPSPPVTSTGPLTFTLRLPVPITAADGRAQAEHTPTKHQPSVKHDLATQGEQKQLDPTSSSMSLALPTSRPLSPASATLVSPAHAAQASSAASSTTTSPVFTAHTPPMTNNAHSSTIAH